MATPCYALMRDSGSALIPTLKREYFPFPVLLRAQLCNVVHVVCDTCDAIRAIHIYLTFLAFLNSALNPWIYAYKVQSHRRTAWGVQRGTRRPQAARSTGRPLLTTISGVARLQGEEASPMAGPG
jgi:hypothetical protein